MLRWVKYSVALAVLIVATCGTARADLFAFSYSGAGLTASGSLTATLISGNTYLISGITGTRNGQSITGLLAPNTFDCGCNDNHLFFPAGGDNPQGNAFLDTGGFAYSTASGTFNPFYNSSIGYNEAIGGSATSSAISSFDVESGPAPIPGAGALSYLIVLLGGLVRWRKALVARARVLALRMREWAFALSRRSGSATSALPPAP